MIGRVLFGCIAFGLCHFLRFKSSVGPVSISDVASVDEPSGTSFADRTVASDNCSLASIFPFFRGNQCMTVWFQAM